jgi:y4mF family transcriptional regulator
MPTAPTPRELGALVRGARQRRHLTQAQLAATLGVSRHWVVEFEQGNPGAEIGLALRALRALGLELRIGEDASAPTPATVSRAPAESPDRVLERLRVLASPPPVRETPRAKRPAKGRK